MSIVQSLRCRDAIEEQNPGPAIVLCEKAADEIERLERVNRGLLEACSSYTKTNERLRTELEAQAKRVAELEAALKADCDAQAQAEAGQRIRELEAALEDERERRAMSTGTLTLEVAKQAKRIRELEAALRKAIAFYDALETPHAPGEPALLDELTGILQSH